LNDTNEPYLDWLNFILNQTSIPQTITTSYGDDEQSVPNDYADSVCNGFAQLGARGVSILFPQEISVLVVATAQPMMARTQFSFSPSSRLHARSSLLSVVLP